MERGGTGGEKYVGCSLYEHQRVFIVQTPLADNGEHPLVSRVERDFEEFHVRGQECVCVNADGGNRKRLCEYKDGSIGGIALDGALCKWESRVLKVSFVAEASDHVERFDRHRSRGRVVCREVFGYVIDGEVLVVEGYFLDR